MKAKKIVKKTLKVIGWSLLALIVAVGVTVFVYAMKARTRSTPDIQAWYEKDSTATFTASLRSDRVLMASNLFQEDGVLLHTQVMGTAWPDQHELYALRLRWIWIRDVDEPVAPKTICFYRESGDSVVIDPAARKPYTTINVKTKDNSANEVDIYYFSYNKIRKLLSEPIVAIGLTGASRGHTRIPCKPEATEQLRVRLEAIHDQMMP